MEDASVGNDLLMERYPDLGLLLSLKPQQELIKLPCLDTIDIIYVYGVGQHYDALQFWLREKKERALIFLEDDLTSLNAFLQTDAGLQALADPQTHLKFISSKDHLPYLIGECVDHFPSERIEVFALKKKNKHTFRKIRLQLLRLSTVAHALLTEALYSHKLLTNVLSHIVHWPSSFFANGLKGKLTNIPAIICGAGPSLTKNRDQLIALQDRALIIAGGSAISALSNQGIVPHLGIALDPNEEEFSRLKSASSFEMPLLYACRLEPRVLNTCNGPKGYLRTQTGGACEAHFERVMGIDVEPIGPELGREALSVTTLAIALAVEMGCNPIILNGVDLAYTNMQRYAEGVIPSVTLCLEELDVMSKSAERLIKKKDTLGKPVYTLVKWVMESQCISAYAKAHPQTCFINVTQGGLNIADIPNRQLSSVDLSQQYDMAALVHTLCAQLPMPPCTQKEIHSETQALHESLKRLHAIASAMIEELQRIAKDPALSLPTGTTTLLELDFREEKAFEALFLLVGPAIDKLLHRAFYSPFPLAEAEQKQQLVRRQIAKWTEVKKMIEIELTVLANTLHRTYQTHL